MKYVVYYKTRMNTKDSINCLDVTERDMWLRALKPKCEALAYAKVYKSGEYGTRNFLIGNALSY